MAIGCKLCRRQLPDTGHDANCGCGWWLDHNCCENHREWCPDGGEDGWIGAVEL
ncbi:hypothetical protein [Halorientalis sp. IM1011]|uniref:hypothetical protein n=1 Tax=Halorientalis sp. IM1011 TaxID=1932360 RepID=UPI0012FA3628|nr:hypothetical protein [Halorientalis sp. IM1011]